MSDAVELIIEPRTRPVGNGTVNRLLPWRRRRMIGPFVFVDHIGPDHLASGTGIDVDAHPHIGLSTLTYLLDGRMVHRDSVGSVQTIEPGAVNWMTAGRGVVHTERSVDADRSLDRTLHGLQIWVALPNGDEDTPPSFEHHPAATIPTTTVSGTPVRLIAGDGWGVHSPVGARSPLVFAELDAVPDVALRIDDAHRERAVVPLDAHASVGGQPLPQGRLAVLSPGERPELVGRGRVMMFGGEPVGERHIWWNFVHSDPSRIDEAKQQWTAQHFPVVPDDHDPWVPLPG